MVEYVANGRYQSLARSRPDNVAQPFDVWFQFGTERWHPLVETPSCGGDYPHDGVRAS